MKYVILIHSNPQPWGHPTVDYTEVGRAIPVAQREQMYKEFDEMLAELKASGEFVTAEALAAPGSSTVYRWQGGRPVEHRRSVRRGEGAVGRVLPVRLRHPGAGRGDRGQVRRAW